jgi:alkylated DNA nucleotide flippase Atl1
VVNAKGECSVGEEQVVRLTAEGIQFDERGKIDLMVCGWDGLEDV